MTLHFKEVCWKSSYNSAKSDKLVKTSTVGPPTPLPLGHHTPEKPFIGAFVFRSTPHFCQVSKLQKSENSIARGIPICCRESNEPLENFQKPCIQGLSACKPNNLP